MAQKYITLSEEALNKLLGLVRESHSVAEGIDDENVATNSVYSSAKIVELLDSIETTGGNDRKGISLIEFTSSTGGETAGIAGATDTYTITYTDNTTSTFDVYNGKDGANGKDGTDGKDGVSPIIGDNGNWFIGEEDTGVSAGGSSSSGTIKVKTGKLATTNGNLQEIPINLHNSVDGNFIDNVFYGITQYTFIETAIDANGLATATKEIQMSQLGSGVDWNGELISFIAAKISGTTYFFFTLKNTYGYETLYGYQSTTGSIIDDYERQGYLNIRQITDVANEPKFMLIGGYVYLAYYIENQDYTTIMTNNPKYTGANELIQFNTIYPEGNRLTGEWQVWGNDDFIFFKNFNNTDEPFRIWKPSNDKLYRPIERNEYDEIEPYYFSYMVYCKGAKCFVAYTETGEFYCRHFLGCEGYYLSNWDEGNINGNVEYLPRCLIATDNYLFVYNYEDFVDMYDKDFNLISTTNRPRFNNIFEIPIGIVSCADNGETVIHLFETEELTIEEAINRLV